MSELQKLYFDFKNYPFAYRCFWFLNPSMVWIVNFRMAAYLYRLRIGKFAYYCYRPLRRVISVLVWIEIHWWTEIGGWLKIVHFGGIFINDRSIIWKNCVIYNNVTIWTSSFESDDLCPTIWDDVKIRVGARVIWKITVWDRTIIWVWSLVNKDFEWNGVLVWVPFKKLEKYNEE